MIFLGIAIGLVFGIPLGVLLANRNYDKDVKEGRKWDRWP